MSESRPLRVAFIGAGNMAGHHLRALGKVSTAYAVVGVHDVTAATAQEFAHRAETRAFASLLDMLHETRPEIVHICTPAGMHFEAAREALRAGAHVYVEKPFVETSREAEELFAIAREHRRIICTGHQLVRDPAFRALMNRAEALGPVTRVDSDFAFRPPRIDPRRSTPRALGAQLVDILPHPLYTLVAALEGAGGTARPIELVHATATSTTLHALLRSGEITGRLCVSLRARPVASTLTVVGAQGSLVADFVRGIVLGAANEGTSPVEKIANPFVEAAQIAWRSSVSLGRRLARGADYPGLVGLLDEFYVAVANDAPSPVSVDHLRRVTSVYELIAMHVRSAVARARPATPSVADVGPSARLAVVTGAAGFFGRGICRALALRGFRVRGIGRGERPDDAPVHEWVRADLAEGIAGDVLAGAAIVVHAAAETAGGVEAHERNTVGATRQLLRAMVAADVRRLVYISSISVLRPPRALWERQTEWTRLAAQAERLGPYTWGKCAAEELVTEAQVRQEIQARIIRPAALIDWQAIDFPGLLGRRLFGKWHLGLGRPGLPFAVCDVGLASAAVAWCADRFMEAPAVVNILEPEIRTRGQLLRRFREHGWHGRVVWVPISILACAMMAARTAMALAHGMRPRPLAVWSILRPRRYDSSVSARVLAAASMEVRPVLPARPLPMTVRVRQAYG